MNAHGIRTGRPGAGRRALGALALAGTVFGSLAAPDGACAAARHSDPPAAPSFDLPADFGRPARDARCWERVRRSAAEPGGFAAALASDVDDYQGLVEKALTYRAETVRVAEALRAKVDAGTPLSGADLRLLNEGTLLHLALREALFDVAERYECLVDAPADTLRATPVSPPSRRKAVSLSLSAALVLYDNYLLAVSLLQEDAKLRRFLDDPDTGYRIEGRQLLDVARSYHSATNRARVRRAIRDFESSGPAFAEDLRDDPQARYLSLLIDESPSYQALRALSPLAVLAGKLDLLGVVTQDSLDALGDEGLNLFSMLFGNAVGAFATRRGKLLGRDDVRSTVSRQLRPGDILVEKTPFRLTDTFIPGHWGHAAIWVGSEADLRALGLWDHPVVRPHREAIRGGRGIVEALRSGVRLSPLEAFLNIDDLGVLRDTALDRERQADVVLLALRQVGKGYDFNFDVETTDRIVCSELVYVAYPHMAWPTAKTLGRATISPDQVAARALEGGPLELVLLYHDGAWVDAAPLETLAALMAKPTPRTAPGGGAFGGRSGPGLADAFFAP